MLKYLSRAPIHRHRVLLRVDFNVPIANGRVGADFRIRAHIPTIRTLIRSGNTVIILAHHSDPRQTLRPVAGTLSRLLGESIRFLPRLESRPPTRSTRIFLLENLRRFRGETESDRAFARVLAKLGDVFVQDAFGAAHRRGASLTILPRLLPARLGLCFERELKLLDQVLVKPKRPLVAIFGGGKQETKLRLVERFSRHADFVLVGGVLGNILLHARGVRTGRSRVSAPRGHVRLLRLARRTNIVLPDDLVTTTARSGIGGTIRSVRSDAVPERAFAYDIGRATVAHFIRIARNAGTIVWNGPLGLSERPQFAKGTIRLARALSGMGSRVIVGGGDTLAVLERARLLPKFPNASTGGGAMIAYLAGEALPALEALRK